MSNVFLNFCAHCSCCGFLLSSLCATDLRDEARAEEPYHYARSKLLRQGAGGGHQLHHRGLEGVHVQHLAPGAHTQVSTELKSQGSQGIPFTSFEIYK